MNKLREHIDNIDYNNLEAKIYNYFSTKYGWDNISEKEYSDNKVTIEDFRKPVFESQDFLLTENRIGKTTFTCCNHYYFLSILDNTLTNLLYCNVKPSFRKSCNCLLTDEDVNNFEAIPALKGVDLITNKRNIDVLELNSREQVLVKNTDTGELLEEFFLCKKIASLPEDISSKLPEDVIDLITEDKIKLIGYGYFNSSPFIRYKIQF